MKTDFGEIAALVRKGHEECGDSAFVYADREKIILAVFDGVSGEKGAANASSVAAKSILDSLKDKAVTQEDVKNAISKASQDIKEGYTTVALAVIKGESLIIASVGDSAIYSKSGKAITLELPLGRPVKKGDSVMKFFAFRNLVTSVIGPTNTAIELRIAEGRINKGDMLILASDGLVDNLFVRTKEGFVKDATGTNDLGTLIKSKSPKKIVKDLDSIIQKRVKKGKIEEKERILDPKVDDVSLIVMA